MNHVSGSGKSKARIDYSQKPQLSLRPTPEQISQRPSRGQTPGFSAWYPLVERGGAWKSVPWIALHAGIFANGVFRNAPHLIKGLFMVYHGRLVTS